MHTLRPGTKGALCRLLPRPLPQGEAFTNVRRGMPGMAYFAGVSLSYSERCEINFGGRPFQHPAEGYQPLQAAPPAVARRGGRAAQLAAARYMAGCLSRLVDVSSAAAPPPAAAAAAAEGAEEGSEDGAGADEMMAATEAAAGQPALPLFQTPGAGVGSRPGLGGSGLLPDAAVLAALEPGRSKATAAAAAPGWPAAAAAAAAGPAICIDDRVLLGAVLAQHLGPLCLDQYAVEAVLLPLLDDAAGDLCSSSAVSYCRSRGPGEASAPPAAAAPTGQELGRQRLRQLLALLAAVLEAEELSALVVTCCSVLERRVRGSLWALPDMPASTALVGLRLWSAMLDCEDIRAGAGGVEGAPAHAAARHAWPCG